jgi:hypothetical protein
MAASARGCQHANEEAQYVPIPGFEFNQFVFTTPYQMACCWSPTPMPPSMQPVDSPEFLAEYRDGLLRVSGGTLQHSESIQLGDYPGLDYTVVLPKSAKNPQGIVDHARVYLVDGRVYGLDFVSRFSMPSAHESVL